MFRVLILALSLCSIGICVYGQHIGLLDSSEFREQDITALKEQFGKNKVLPEGYELQALLALSYYPELTDVKVKFVPRRKGGPFVSRPTVWSTFFKKPPRRTYKVFFRTASHSFFDPILMANMPFNAQVGVLGHELGHTADFLDRRLGKMVGVILGNLSWRYMDSFEFATDRRAIAHGLGYQILAWSEHASKTLRVNEPAFDDNSNSKMEGVIQRERYMRPSTIRKEMAGLEIYHLPALDGSSTSSHP